MSFYNSKVPPKKVLVINIFGIGDVLFTTPLLANLKSAYPQVKIGYLCNRRSIQVLETNPNVDKLFFYVRDEFVAAYKRSKIEYVKKMLKFWAEIKAEGYEAVIDVSLSSFTSFFCFWIGIPKRIGFNFRGRSPWLTDRIALEGYEGKHVVEHYLQLLDRMGVKQQHKKLDLYITKEDEEFANQFLNQRGLGQSKKLIGLVAGGGASWGKDADYKRWGLANYANLADKIIEKFSCEVILFGDQSESQLNQLLVEQMKHKPVVAVGQTTLRQMAALIKRTNLMIVNDGGPLHISVAAGVKTCSIFGPVDDLVYGPFPLNGHAVVALDLSCRPCYRRFRKASCDHLSCLKTLTVEQVFKKVNELLTQI